jgi:two-component system NtrC family sensor kinase
VARPLRLRQKLTLGLALTVGSVALLVGGIALAYLSHVTADKATAEKLVQIQLVMQVHDCAYLMTVTPAERTDRAGQIDHIHECAANARVVTAYFRTLLDRPEIDPLARETGRDYADKIDAALARVDAEVTKAAAATMTVTSRRVIEEPAVKAAHDALTALGPELILHIKRDIDDTFATASREHRKSLVIAGAATILAVVMVLTNLYYFRVWVFAPIRELQAGVQRVHRGNFDLPIRLRSKDELEELANEFNAMTARLRDIYKDLARQVDERSKQLVRSERLVSVGFLAAGVAHEINNPLASIAFCAEALDRRVRDLLPHATQDSEAVSKYLRMIQEEAFRCKEITQKLLDFSRTGGKRERADLNRLVSDVLDMARHLPNCKGKGIGFHADTAVAAEVNARDIKSVVLNLAVNALDAMDDGGRLSVALGQAGDAATLTFTDTGCGMTPDVLENVFEPFFTKNRTGTGTGLGLSISHQIIARHGGTITAASGGPGTGSTFTVRLPLRSVNQTTDDAPDVLSFPAPHAVAAAA